VSKKVWCVIYCKPRQENRVTAYLLQRGFEFFYPTIPVKPANPRASKRRAFFPRYLFVRAGLHEVGMGVLQWIPGAIELVKFGGEPAIVPDDVINALRRRSATIEAASGVNVDELQPGDSVRITAGPMAGYEAIFDLRLNGTQRVQVLLEMLSHHVRVEMSADSIERNMH
jgi:transcriptional antiterminator RfaH